MTSIRHLRFAFCTGRYFTILPFLTRLYCYALSCVCSVLFLYPQSLSSRPSVRSGYPLVSLEKEKNIQYREETNRDTQIRTARLARTAKQSIVVETPVLVEARPNLFAGPSAGSSRALPFLLFAHFPRSLFSLPKPLFDVNLHSFFFLSLCLSFIRSFYFNSVGAIHSF